MYFKYCEELNRKRNNMPSVFINSNSDYLDIKNTQELNLIDFIDGFPDDSLSELDKLFKYAENFSLSYINRETWIKFQIAYKIKIPPISKEIKRTIIGSGEYRNNKYITAKYVENKKEKDLTFKKNDFFIKEANLNLFETLENNYSNYNITIHKDAIFNDFKNLLYIFLECLFTSNINYYIKKCEYCHYFYITNKSDNQYCKRINNINGVAISCSKITASLQKTYPYKQLMKLDKNFMNSIASNGNISEQYIDNYKKLKKEAKQQYFRDKNFNKLENFIKNYKENNPFC